MNIQYILTQHEIWIESEDKRGERADLTDAYLRYADLTGAILTDADLTGADLTGAIGIIDLGQDTRGYRFILSKQDAGYKIAADCRWFTPEEAQKHWNNRHAGVPTLHAEILARLEMAEKLAEIYGWIEQ